MTSQTFNSAKWSLFSMSSLLLIGAAAVLPGAGCADVPQDQSEIPATIGQTQDVEQQQTPWEKSAVETAARDSEPDSSLESASPADSGSTAQKQDLATLLEKEKEEFEQQTIDIPPTWKRLDQESHIWADKKNKQVIVRGAVCIQEGLLEMFACPRGTKEHEAVVSIHAKAWQAHATLLALGVQPGAPMVWMEEYFPVHGPILNIDVWWTDAQGKLVKRKAQDLVRNTETGKALDADFVFGGSELIYDPYTKKRDYLADFGPFINVANQPDAMIDISVLSSADAQGSLFEAFTENLPPVNTKVYILLSASGKTIASKEGKPTPQELARQREEAMRIRQQEIEAMRDE